MTPDSIEKTKRNKSLENGVSFPEKVLSFYIKQIVEIKENYRPKWLNRKELDIYIPDIKLAIEYDGKLWHQDTERDLIKDRICAEHDVELIHIREIGLPVIQGMNAYYVDTNDKVNFNQVIERLLNYICQTIGNCSSISDVDIHKDNIAIQESYISTTKKRSLANLRSEIAKEWHPTKNGSLTAEMYAVYSEREVWWMCPKGHEWEAPIAARTNQGQGCPYCSSHRVLSGFNDLKTNNEKLASEWHPTKNGSLTPDDVTSNSHKTVWWMCPKGHEWEATINSRFCGNDCPYCATGGRLLTGFNDLATRDPTLAEQWHPIKNGSLTPHHVRPGSEVKVWWMCPQGHEWEATVKDRSKGRGCPYCSGRKILQGFNDLATLNPELAGEWHPTKNKPFSPYDVSPNSHKKVWWLGKCGHEWESQICNRSKGSGCPYCSGNKVLKGFNDLATLNPELAGEWHPIKNSELTPFEVGIGSDKKVWWLGKCGHEWSAWINDRVHGHGCPYCSKKRK